MRPRTEPPTGRLARTIAFAGMFSIAGLAAPAVAGAFPGPSDAATDAIARSVDTAPVDSAPVDVRPTDRKPEVLRLNCNVRQTDHAPDRAKDVRSAVVCRWSAPTSDAAVAVRLLRVVIGSGEGREVIYRSTNLEVNEYIDAAVRQGHRYAYAVQAVDTNGRIVGMSRPETVAVPVVGTPTVEVLKLRCAVLNLSEPDARHRVGCEWSVPHADGARVLTLWRSIDGAARERVVSFTHPFKTAYRDVVPAGAHRVSYAVIVTDSHGEIVARSRATTLRIPDRTRPPIVITPDRPVSDVPVTDVPATDVLTKTDAPVTVVPVRDVPKIEPTAGDTVVVQVDVADKTDVRPDRARPDRVRPDRAGGEATD